MKWSMYLSSVFLLAGCAVNAPQDNGMERSDTAGAQVGIVNHTGKYIYSASVDGAGGGNMARWGAGGANICCASIPRIWHPGINVLVRWNMPEGTTDVIKEKMVQVEKYDRPGDIYMHFFDNDEVRVVVSNDAGYGKDHPIQHTGKPVTEK